MSARPEPSIRLRADLTNPGHFYACCGLLELADRLWRGAEGWFDEGQDAFCVAPLDASTGRDFTAAELLKAFLACGISNPDMTEEQRERREVLAKNKRKLSRAEQDEKRALDALWEQAKDGALALGAPFHLRLDWYLDARAGGSRFKTWAGQQTVTQLVSDLMGAASAADFEENPSEWLFARVPCESGSLQFDASGAGTDLDIGFSLDPLKMGSRDKRVLVHLWSLIGLQRFRPRKPNKENLYVYAAWHEPLVPEVASAAAAGSMRATTTRRFRFRLLYRTKYLKSFLPAVLQGEHE